MVSGLFDGTHFKRKSWGRGDPPTSEWPNKQPPRKQREQARKQREQTRKQRETCENHWETSEKPMRTNRNQRETSSTKRGVIYTFDPRFGGKKQARNKGDQPSADLHAWTKVRREKEQTRHRWLKSSERTGSKTPRFRAWVLPTLEDTNGRIIWNIGGFATLQKKDPFKMMCYIQSYSDNSVQLVYL